ncbi:MAG: flagellar filament capping protein FliD [Bryobacteraceae bacterium]
MASSTSSTGFTGSSSYSADLQTAVSRAVSFASLPLQLLQNQQAGLTGQQSEIATLTSKFSSLQTALDNINSAVGTGSFSASVTTTAVATAYAGAGVRAGSYNLAVLSTGAHTNTISQDGLTKVSDPSSGSISAASTLKLTVDGTDYQISNSGNSLNSLADAINASSANVQATLVNVGSSSTPDYRVSIQGKKYAASSIQLSDRSTPLLNTLTTGSNVTYQLNGQSNIISSDSRTLTLSTGLTVNVLQAGSTDINVNQGSTQASNAINAFATAYNNVVDELAKSRGKNGGALSGQSIVYTLSTSLRGILDTTAQSGSVKSLNDLGLSFDDNGHLNFDSSAFSTAASSSFSNILGFLGSESSGGFLKSANTALAGITDSTTGILAASNSSISTSLSNLADKISNKTNQISDLQTSLTAKMSAADATISSLEQQVSYYTNLFTTMRQNNSNG